MPDYSLNWIARFNAILELQMCQWCSSPARRWSSRSHGALTVLHGCQPVSWTVGENSQDYMNYMQVTSSLWTGVLSYPYAEDRQLQKDYVYLGYSFFVEGGIVFFTHIQAIGSSRMWASTLDVGYSCHLFFRVEILNLTPQKRYRELHKMFPNNRYSLYLWFILPVGLNCVLPFCSG